MPYKYKIEVNQLSKKDTYAGLINSISEIPALLKDVEKTLVKDEIATINFSYTEVNEEKKTLERAKIRKVVEEEYAKVMKEKC